MATPSPHTVAKQMCGKGAGGLGACSELPQWGWGAKPPKTLQFNTFNLKCFKIIQMQPWKVYANIQAHSSQCFLSYMLLPAIAAIIRC